MLTSVNKKKRSKQLFRKRQKGNKEELTSDTSKLLQGPQSCQEIEAQEPDVTASSQTQGETRLIGSTLCPKDESSVNCSRVPVSSWNLLSDDSDLPSCGFSKNKLVQKNCEELLNSDDVGEHTSDLTSEVSLSCCIDNEKNEQIESDIVRHLGAKSDTQQCQDTQTNIANKVPEKAKEEIITSDSSNDCLNTSSMNISSSVCKSQMTVTCQVAVSRRTNDHHSNSISSDALDCSDQCEDKIPLLASVHGTETSSHEVRKKREFRQSTVDALCSNFEKLRNSEKQKLGKKRRRIWRKRRITRKRAKHYAVKSGRFLWKGFYESAKLLRSGFVLYVGAPFGAMNFESNFAKAFDERKRNRQFYDYTSNTRTAFRKETRV